MSPSRRSSTPAPHVHVHPSLYSSTTPRPPPCIGTWGEGGPDVGAAAETFVRRNILSCRCNPSPSPAGAYIPLLPLGHGLGHGGTPPPVTPALHLTLLLSLSTIFFWSSYILFFSYSSLGPSYSKNIPRNIPTENLFHILVEQKSSRNRSFQG